MAAPGIPHWQVQILKGIGAPVTPQNIRFLNAWTQVEGGAASNNPFNTTEPGFTATGNYNSVGVKNYATPAGGIQATVATLKNGRYGNILSALAQGTSAQAAAQALANSPWGTGSLVEKVLGGPAKTPPAVAPQAVSPSPKAQLPTPISGARLSPALLALFNQGNQMFGLPALPATLAMTPPPQAKPTGKVASTPHRPGKTPPAPTKGPTYKWIEHFAAPFHLSVTATTNGTHAPHSYHYQGRAVDFAGAPENMAKLADYALQHPGQFKELFYTGPGHPNVFISDGKVLPLSQLDPALYREHENHVHLAR